MIDTLRNTFLHQLQNTPLQFRRYMHERLDMEEKLIGIIGSRGVGKTTFILQYLKMLDLPFDRKLYFSADHFEVINHSIYEIIEAFYRQGGEIVAIDEIHKYPSFERELKSIYDTFDIRVIFSGSSALELEHAKIDLSRRALLYRINGLSFREFLEFETKERFMAYSLEEILQNHTEIALAVMEKIKPFAYFRDYLRYGYYPFYKQSRRSYHQKLYETVTVVLESDLPMVFNIEPKNIFKLKKLLSLLCESKPYELNITRLASKIEINRNTLYHYLHYLQKGGLLMLVRQQAKGHAVFAKPEKLYLGNPNLNFSYCQNSETGTIRETFFVNQLGCDHTVHYAPKGDFLIDGKYTFEIGGKSKDFSQISGVEESYVAADDIEVGTGRKIPLWLFGFLY